MARPPGRRIQHNAEEDDTNVSDHVQGLEPATRELAAQYITVIRTADTSSSLTRAAAEHGTNYKPIPSSFNVCHIHNLTSEHKTTSSCYRSTADTSTYNYVSPRDSCSVLQLLILLTRTVPYVTDQFC